jgi:hypothetical protein
MTPMVFMILKWEKVLERPDRPLIQWQTYARLLKTKEKKQLEGKDINSAKTRNGCASVDLGKYQTSTN